jgi:hypothetical protein
MAFTVIWGIAFATTLTALLLVAPLHHIGFTWKWAWLTSITLAVATGVSAAESVGIF